MDERICASKIVSARESSDPGLRKAINPAKTSIYARARQAQDILELGREEMGEERRQRRGASGAPIVEKRTERGQGALLGLVGVSPSRRHLFIRYARTIC